MSLLDDAIWWHVYPLGALGAPIHERKGSESGHRLRRLDAWLDYAIELGCSGLLLGPIFDSVSHGYDTLDHFAIDPRLGDADDFDRLVAECRARGLNILLDGVFNHVAASHPDAARLSRRGEDGAVRSWEGHGGLTALDHSNSEVADLVAEVMLHWLRRGIAGWRLDVAYEVPPEFWREVTGRVRREFPGVLFLGEMIHGDYSGFVEASGLDTVTQYELWKGTWSSIKDRNFWERDVPRFRAADVHRESRRHPDRERSGRRRRRPGRHGPLHAARHALRLLRRRTGFPGPETRRPARRRRAAPAVARFPGGPVSRGRMDVSDLSAAHRPATPQSVVVEGPPESDRQGKRVDRVQGERRRSGSGPARQARTRTTVLGHGHVRR